jgi:hypothetical protein
LATGCSWCLGKLTKDGTLLDGNGHCFGGAAHQYTCEGLTLQQDCTVYKCPWYKYYEDRPADCTGLEAGCNNATTADDPDFARDYPASGYKTKDACQQSCVDPTTGCTSGHCAKTHTCDPDSTCTACKEGDKPPLFQGIQISENYTAGLWTFAFGLSADNGTYTGVNVTSPAGAVTQYEVRSWVGSKDQGYTATLAQGSALKGMRAALGDGALGHNFYMAIGATEDIPDWGPVLNNGGQEFSLLACEYVAWQPGPVSGKSNSIQCKIGALHA